ncbi:MoaF-related domain-containing protein [Streptomyces sp. NBC_01615]|uniref:MoaF-related domain-containing protein n=1 Tax=Streptomyces sp. NBC_01615 TaxID=2975898 RepID=UPI0038675F3C
MTSTDAAAPAFAGRRYVFRVDNGTVFRNTYAADGRTLHWHTVEGPAKGTAETVTLHHAEIAPNLYFVSWIEASGTTVSHVMDLNRNTVRAFWTYADEAAPVGDRSGELHTGTLTPETA